MLINYFFIRLITFPLAFFPYRFLHLLGKILGSLAYYLFPSFRKKALSNLALAYELNLSNEDIKRIAKGSFQTLITTCLEYPKLAREKDISKIAVCDNPEEANAIMAKGNGVIFFCGHQSNWELLFLEGTSRMKGVAIGRPIKNHHLYRWIISMREKFGGKIVEPKNGIKEGIQALKSGAFMGIVGDQGMPDSGFSSPFLGRLAWTSPIPALLSYKTETPLIVATTTFREGKYHIHYSNPLFPNKKTPKEIEVPRLMNEALHLYAQSIKEKPEEWLWIHNRWKQQTLDQIKRPFRHDSLALILPNTPSLFEDLPKIRKLYPTEEITVFVPKGFENTISIEAQIYPYQSIKDILQKTYKYKLIYDFLKDAKIKKHYEKFATQTIFQPNSLQEIEKLCLKTDSF